VRTAAAQDPEVLIDTIAEERILKALAEGAFEILPGAGRPLSLEDEPLVPEDLRTAYRLLKNAGYLPPEVSLRREIRSAGVLLTSALAPEERERAGRRLEYLLGKLAALRGPRYDLRQEQDYWRRIRERL
jgi:hypothetical protein